MEKNGDKFPKTRINNVLPSPQGQALPGKGNKLSYQSNFETDFTEQIAYIQF